MADVNALIEVDAKDLASPKLVKVTKNLKDVGDSGGFVGKVMGDLKGKVEGAGVPLSQMSSYLGSAGLAAGGAVLAVGAVAVGLGALAFNAADSLAALQDVSDQTGASVESLSKMALVLKLTNMDTKSYGDALTKLSVNINKNSDDFKKLGVSTTDPQKAMLQLKKIIADTPDQLKKVEIGNMAFGKSFKDLMPFLQMPQEEMEKLIDIAPEISSSQAQAAAQLMDSWDTAKFQLQSFGTTIGIAVMPYLNALIQTFGVIVNVISPVISIFGRLISVSFSLAQTLYDKLAPTINKVFEPIINSVKTLFGWFEKLLGKVEAYIGKSKEVSSSTPKFEIPELEEPIAKVEKPKGKTAADAKAEVRESNKQFEIDQYNAKVKRERDLADLLAKNEFERNKKAEEEQEKRDEDKKKQKLEDQKEWMTANQKWADEQVKIQEDAAERTRQAWENVANSLASNLETPLEDFQKNIIRGNQSVLTSFKDLFGDILNNFGNMLTQMVAQYLAKAAIMAAVNFFTGGSAGGVLSIGSFLGFNATGTDDWRGGLTVVGERGPEIINLPPRSSVTPMNEVNSGSTTYTINIVNPTERLTDTALLKMAKRNENFAKNDRVNGWRYA